MTVGLTGGFGCGKSTAAKLFTQHGYRAIDLDFLVRERVLRNPEIVREIRGHFGGGVIDAEGQVNRAALAQVVFSHDAEREWLESTTHPAVFALWDEAVAAEPGADWVVEVPLLFEKGLENRFDFIVCVTCAPGQQLARLEQRGLSRALAEQRISKQLPLARKVELSDFVLLNDGTTDFLREQVELLITHFHTPECRCHRRPLTNPLPPPATNRNLPT